MARLDGLRGGAALGDFARRALPGRLPVLLLRREGLGIVRASVEPLYGVGDVVRGGFPAKRRDLDAP